MAARLFPGTPSRLRTLVVVILRMNGVVMRRRLKNFLPIALLALAVQVLAPIATCWAASIAASDPLSAPVICHGNAAAAGQDDQSGTQDALTACCGLCGVLHTGAPVDRPATEAIFTF